jgi:hypothetical protein
MLCGPTVNQITSRALQGTSNEHEKEKGIMKHDVIDPTAVLERTEQKASSGKADTEKQEMQNKVAAAGRPGPAHKALDDLVGNWKAEVKCWMEPGGVPNVSQGTPKASWTLNGHFL